uniref:DUF4843 domain-containing protein n=3 Tax=unclassified Prevotella TaxID=2638335 RepID=A0AB33IXP3_9BACT
MKYKKSIILCSVMSILLTVGFTSCDSDRSAVNLLTLSQYTATVKIGDTVAVDINLSDPSAVNAINVKKSINGKTVESYEHTFQAASMTFPYTFRQEIVSGDETGILVYSFYAKDANNDNVDAADIVCTVDIAQMPLLLKYDWKLTSQIIQSDDYATADMKDNINRFNPDLTWEVDWGDVYSAGRMETLDSYCSWQAVMNGAKVDSLYTIKYNIFSPAAPVITKYKVLQLEDRKMILESRQDLSFLPGYAADERVVETFEPVSKTDDFRPYGGANPASYHIEACNPGSY